MAAFSAGTLAFAWPVSVGHSARAADVSFKLVNGVCGSGQVTVGQGCWDQQVSFFKQNWSVNDGTATYTAADVSETFNWSLPGTIIKSGAKAHLAVEANDVTNSAGIDAKLCVVQSAFTVTGRCAEAYAATAGSSKSDNTNVTLAFASGAPAAGACAGGGSGCVSLAVGIQDGGNVYYTYRASSAPAGGPAPAVAPTSKVPFGTPVTINYRLRKVVGASSPSLPAATSEVDLNTEISDADVTRMAAALKLALNAYNKRRQAARWSYFCLFVSDGTFSWQSLTVTGLTDFGGAAERCDKWTAVLLKRALTQSRQLEALTGGCSVRFIPVWKPGTRPTTAEANAAVAFARSQVQASCSSSGRDQLTLRVSTRGKTTLNPALGTSAQASVGADGKATGTPQMTVSWSPPHTKGAPPPAAKAKPGHYAGQDSANNSISFDVTADSANVTNLSMAGHVTCTDNSGWTWTLSSSSKNPISSSLAFSRSYSGGLTVSDTTISNLNATYTMSGTLTKSGSANGIFQISHISWDQNGTHYDCTGTPASWTAQLSG